MATQHPIEVILLKQWAPYIAFPVWISDEAGNLIYYNEPAEDVLGQRFDEVGTIHASELAERYATPTSTALPSRPRSSRSSSLSHRGSPRTDRFGSRTISGAGGSATFRQPPIEGQAGRHLGAFAMFWER